MDAEFWIARWEEGRTRFHQDEVMPLLIAHWPALARPEGSRVLVPLAGKSLDMLWLASQGHRVLGVEVSPIAVEQFFSEHQLQPVVTAHPYGRRYTAGRIEMICGDVFDLPDEELADWMGAYDRAALIALPAEMRVRYAEELYARLPAGCRALLITLEFPLHERAGPPFPVTAGEVDALFASQWSIRMRERRDILHSEPAWVEDGVSSLVTAVYELQRRD